MDVLALEDLFAVLGNLPRLTGAEQADRCRAIDRRSMDEVHDCVFCGDRGPVIIVAGPSDLLGPPKWLDLCPPHYAALREMLDADPFLADDEILRRYEAWGRGQSVTDTRNPHRV